MFFYDYFISFFLFCFLLGAKRSFCFQNEAMVAPCPVAACRKEEKGIEMKIENKVGRTKKSCNMQFIE